MGAPTCKICGSTYSFLLFEGTTNEQWKCAANNHRFNREGIYLSMAGDGEKGGQRAGMKLNQRPPPVV